MGRRVVNYIERKADGSEGSRQISLTEALRILEPYGGRPNKDGITEVGIVRPLIGADGSMYTYVITKGGNRYYANMISRGWVDSQDKLPERKQRGHMW